MAEALQRPSWRIRRTIIVATLIFCAAEIIYLTIWGKDTDLSSTIANGLIILAGSVIGAYVFGAVWDDRNIMAMSRGRRPASADDTPEPPKDFAG
jgi:quinol-cytochrome oxidoreductase complex cytochrome b subunit